MYKFCYMVISMVSNLVLHACPMVGLHRRMVKIPSLWDTEVYIFIKSLFFNV